jgi:pimeloyl-ACP methyl ester carboxylesterase
VTTTFTAAHRGGSGPPLVLLHGFTDTWRTWDLVLPRLEGHHDVLAPTFPGHAGGPALPGEVTGDVLPDAVEAAMDEAGFGTAHIAGNSLGGYVALQLAARGRARSVTAFAPAGGWTPGAEWAQQMLDGFTAFQAQARAAAPHAAAITATAEGRRQATRSIVEDPRHMPAELIAHQMLGVTLCAVAPMIECALREGYRLDAEAIACPVRIVWGTRDALLPWPAAAVRYRTEMLPTADWVELEGVGHCPQLDVPLEAAELILGLTGA